MSWLTCGVMGLAAAAASPLALGESESPRDYAWGIELALDGDAEWYEFAVPREVYESGVRADLRDVRIFDAAGEPVPYALRPRVATNVGAAPATAVDLPLHPLHTFSAAGVDAVDMRVSHESGREAIVIEAPDGGANPPIVGYLADARAITQPLRAVRVVLPAAASDVVRRLTIEASDDLRIWTPLASDAPILQLRAGVHRLERGRIEFAPRRVQFLRLSWPGATRPLEVSAIRAEPGTPVREPSRQWKDVSAVPAATTPNRYEIDLGGRFPVDRLSFALPQTNTIATMAIYSRASLLEAWELIDSATLYRLNGEGGDFVSDDVVLDGSPRRYWRIAFDPRGSGIGRGDLRVRAGWVPHRIVFAARGARPFVLAYGNGDAESAALPIETLIPGYGSDAPDARVVIGRARVQEPHALAGESVIVRGFDWRRTALWISLALSIALLAAMALQVARQMVSKS
jgi:hypothetical protein